MGLLTEPEQQQKLDDVFPSKGDIAIDSLHRTLFETRRRQYSSRHYTMWLSPSHIFPIRIRTRIFVAFFVEKNLLLACPSDITVPAAPPMRKR